MQDFDKYVAAAKLQPNLDILGQTVAFIPVKNSMTQRQAVAAAIVLSIRDGQIIHNVVVAMSDVFALNEPAEDAFAFWCGDRFLEGGNPREREINNCNSIIARMACYPHTNDVRVLLSAGQQSIAKEMMAAYQLLAGPDTPCDFWPQWRRDRTVCRHTQHALATLRDSMPNFKQYLEANLKEALELFPEYSKSAIPALVAQEPAPFQLYPDAKPRYSWTTRKPVEKEAASYVLPAAVSLQLLKNASSLVNLGLSLENFVVTEEYGMDYVLLTAYEDTSSKEPAGCVRVQYYANEAQAREARTEAPGRRHGQEVHLVQVLNSGQVIADGEMAKYVQAARNFLTYSVVP